ncbi:hypothetical protein TL5118_00477 [Thalassovita autumnalis]|uniref:Sulfotransferase family protein n=1 Tax=Thalassovita autumnalis TaxID=2072972 RepID=A0A0P1F6L6_9RHOB|nr:hypothetical protein [Thalassovita autumnalis]CUH63455.1 hypothetical protein TL5118_00477 [Thalassovita autumnalis]CUH71922.1 hypothetical protein TL5120_01715 [Thalassovita autumnalis]
MLVFVDANIALFAVPKTGSTAYHLALKSKADITLAGKQALKHMPLRKYDRHFAPFLKEAYNLTPERVAVMRDPVEQIRSWYKYRSRDKVRGGNAVPEGMSFDDFVAEVIDRKPHPCAKLGSQFTFLTSDDGALRTDHLFAYERPVKLVTFLQDRIGKPFETQQKNVSPHRDAPLSGEMEAELRQARAEEFALYDRVMQAGGHLHTPIET